MLCRVEMCCCCCGYCVCACACVRACVRVLCGVLACVSGVYTHNIQKAVGFALPGEEVHVVPR